MEVNISDFLSGIIYCVLQYAVGWTVYLNGDAAFLGLDSTKLKGLTFLIYVWVPMLAPKREIILDAIL